MSNCNADPKVASFLPEHVRNAHGNLAEQSREFGALRGADTTKPAQAQGRAAAVSMVSTDTAKSVVTSASVATAKNTEKASEAPARLKSSDVSAILSKNSCSACHGIDNKIVGPSFKEVATKQGGKSDALAYLTGKIKSGGSGVYGSIPMPPQTIGDADAKKVAQWISQGAAK